MKQEINNLLEKHNVVIGAICSFDRNENDYDFEFFLCKKGEANSTAFELEMRHMVDVAIWEPTIEDAIKDGLSGCGDFYNIDEYED